MTECGNCERLRAEREALRKMLARVANEFHLTIDHECPPPPSGACYRCVTYRAARDLATLSATPEGT